MNNTDLKILTKILAERVKTVLPFIIHTNQCGCVKGRKIGQGIRLVEDVKECMDERNVILQGDQEKAFDRIEWEWLFYVLEKFEFGDYFIGWIKIIYKHMKSAILTNGFVSPYFEITRGIRQGDPLSALLYVIQSEPLSESIRCNCKIKGIQVKDNDGNFHEIKGSQYVDDSNNMLLNVDYIHECLGVIELFGEASGSRLNRGKSLALVSQHFADNGSLSGIMNVKKSTEIVLGVPVGEGPAKTQFWNEKIEKMKNRIQMWKVRDLSLFGKVHICKSLVLPLIQFATAHVDIGDNFVQDIQNLIWTYIWKWKTCFVPRYICHLPRLNGGLGAPNVEYMIKAARIKMLINIMSCCEEWNVLAKSYLCCLDNSYDIKNFAMLVSNSSNEIDKCQIPSFYKKCLLAFQEINRIALVKFENNILWCNNDFRYKNKVFEWKHWSKNGIKYVSDVIMDSNFSFVSVSNSLHKKAGCASYVFEYATLIKNIPVNFVTSCNPDASPSFDNLKYNVPGKDTPVNVFDLTSRDIYLILVWGSVKERKSEIYWQNKFKDVVIDYPMLYKCLFTSKIIPRKCLDFNFRIMNGQVLMEKYLVKMKLSDGRCFCCYNYEADVLHLFLHCPYFVHMWSFVIDILSKIGYDNVSHFNKVFGFLDKGQKHDTANMIVSLARWISWKRHCDIKKGNEIKIDCVKMQYVLSLKDHVNTLMHCKNVFDRNSEKQCQILHNVLKI